MKIHVSMTWDDWYPHWFEMRDYLSIGVGPIFIEFYWGKSLPPWRV